MASVVVTSILYCYRLLLMHEKTFDEPAPYWDDRYRPWAILLHLLPNAI